jgi:hypothetical protein
MSQVIYQANFNGGSAVLNQPSGGFVHSVTISIPTASSAQSFVVTMDGTIVGSIEGTAGFGPLQIFQGHQVVVTPNTGTVVGANQTLTVYGQNDSIANAPTGIFPQVNGGTITIAGGGSALLAERVGSPQVGTGNGQPSVFDVDFANVGDTVVLAMVAPGGAPELSASTCLNDFQIVGTVAASPTLYKTIVLATVTATTGTISITTGFPEYFYWIAQEYGPDNAVFAPDGDPAGGTGNNKAGVMPAVTPTQSGELYVGLVLIEGGTGPITSPTSGVSLTYFGPSTAPDTFAYIDLLETAAGIPPLIVWQNPVAETYESVSSLIYSIPI